MTTFKRVWITACVAILCSCSTGKFRSDTLQLPPMQRKANVVISLHVPHVPGQAVYVFPSTAIEILSAQADLETLKATASGAPQVISEELKVVAETDVSYLLHFPYEKAENAWLLQSFSRGERTSAINYRVPEKTGRLDIYYRCWFPSGKVSKILRVTVNFAAGTEGTDTE